MTTQIAVGLYLAALLGAAAYVVFLVVRYRRRARALEHAMIREQEALMAHLRNGDVPPPLARGNEPNRSRSWIFAALVEKRPRRGEQAAREAELVRLMRALAVAKRVRDEGDVAPATTHRGEEADTAPGAVVWLDD